MTPDLVIFDCDGVLIDSEVIAAEIEAEALSAVGYDVSAQDVIERFLGRPTADVHKMVETALGRVLPGGFGAAIDARITAAYRERLLPIPGIFDVLRKLQVPRCVASSSAPAKLVPGLLETGLLEEFYPHIFSTVLVAHGKPAPDIFQFAAAQCGANPAATVVVEDSPSGVEAGRRAGMTVIGFTGGAHCRPGHAERLRAGGAHAIVRHFDGFHDTLHDLCQAC
ncbi:MAG: HAD family hydrolase [Pseudomonadota bacterium]